MNDKDTIADKEKNDKIVGIVAFLYCSDDLSYVMNEQTVGVL